MWVLATVSVILMTVTTECFRTSGKFPSVGSWLHKHLVTAPHDATVFRVSASASYHQSPADISTRNFVTPLAFAMVDNENVFSLPAEQYQLLQSLGTDQADMPFYEAILRQCAKDGDNRMAEAVLHQMRSFNFELSHQSFEYIVQAFLQYASQLLSGSFPSSAGVTANLQYTQLPLSDDSLSNGADGGAQQALAAAARAAADGRDVFMEMMRSGFNPTNDLLCALVIALGRTGQPEVAEEVLDKVALVSGIDMDTDVYNALMAAHSLSSGASALSVGGGDVLSLPIPSFPALSEDDDGSNGSFDSDTLLNNDGNHNVSAAGAAKMFRAAPKRVVHPERMSKVQEIYRRMLYIGLQPSTRTYEILFHTMLNHQPSVGAFTAFWKLYLRMVDYHRLRPSALVFEQLLASCAHDTTLSVTDAKAMVTRLLTDASRFRSKDNANLRMSNNSSSGSSSSSSSSTSQPLTRSSYESVLYIYSRDAFASAEAMRTLQQIYTAMSSTVGVNSERVYPLLVSFIYRATILIGVAQLVHSSLCCM